MTTVLSFPGHKWAHCTNVECYGCYLCQGGLSQCTVCGGAEGALTTDCPGEMSDWMVIEEVYKGNVDFIRREGWVQRPSRHSPAYCRGFKCE
jgi:hypothetical protein